MPADQLRNRTVGCKMTEAECERLIAVAERDGLKLSEWCREALLRQAGVQKPRALEEMVLAEIIALRTILLNAHYKLAHGEALTPDEMQRLIERADQDKFCKAQERLAASAAGGPK
ncbi:MAG TPA: hypothetical protein VNK23_08275 [Candidatus Dormibacteraeota bacterium]|nr:hypothetical protein [Candidatus Dormibacteraeota bacterium]